MGLTFETPLEWEKIAPDSMLEACFCNRRGFGGVLAPLISIRGPCGEGHTLSIPEARALRDWLSNHIPPDV